MKKNSGRLIVFWLPLALVIMATLTMSACSSGSTTGSDQTAVNPGQSMQDSTPQSPGQGGRMMGGGSSGTIKTISGSTLTLKTDQGEVSVTVNSDTVYQKTVTGSTSDLQKGVTLSVIGTTGADNQITATSIVIRPEGQGSQTGFPGGMGQSRGGMPDGQNQPAGAVPYASGVPGGQNPPTGAFPNASGIPQQPGIGNYPGFQSGNQGRSGAMGTLTAIDGNNLTLSGIQGEEIKITINSSTTIQKITSGSMTDLQIGQSISVMGSRDSNNVLTATIVMLQ